MRTPRLSLVTVQVLVLAGLVTFVLGTIVDSGFFHGMFQGATVALMVAAAAVFGAQWSRRGSADTDDGSDAMWLPSRDEDRS